MDYNRLTPSVAFRAPNAPVAFSLGVAPLVPRVPVSGSTAEYFKGVDTSKLAWEHQFAPGGAVQQTPQGGAVPTTTPGGTQVPTRTLPTGTQARFIPDMAALLAQKQRQQQQQYVQQSVSVPVSTQFAPTTTITVGPSAPQDYGAMVPAAVAAGAEGFQMNRCFIAIAAGALLAFLFGRRRSTGG